MEHEEQDFTHKQKKSTDRTRSVAIPFLVTRGWSEFSLIDLIMDEKKSWSNQSLSILGKFNHTTFDFINIKSHQF